MEYEMSRMRLIGRRRASRGRRGNDGTIKACLLSNSPMTTTEIYFTIGKVAKDVQSTVLIVHLEMF